ncbi:MAG: hypothetical protein WC130_03700 [Kiritimatiellia bacterium]
MPTITIRDTEDQFHKFDADNHVMFENDRGVQIRRVDYDDDGNPRYTLVGAFQSFIFAKITDQAPAKAKPESKGKYTMKANIDYGHGQTETIEAELPVDSDEFTAAEIAARKAVTGDAPKLETVPAQTELDNMYDPLEIKE